MIRPACTVMIANIFLPRRYFARIADKGEFLRAKPARQFTIQVTVDL